MRHRRVIKDSTWKWTQSWKRSTSGKKLFSTCRYLQGYKWQLWLLKTHTCVKSRSLSRQIHVPSSAAGVESHQLPGFVEYPSRHMRRPVKRISSRANLCGSGVCLHSQWSWNDRNPSQCIVVLHTWKSWYWFSFCASITFAFCYHFLWFSGCHTLQHSFQGVTNYHYVTFWVVEYSLPSGNVRCSKFASASVSKNKFKFFREDGKILVPPVCLLGRFPTTSNEKISFSFLVFAGIFAIFRCSMGDASATSGILSAELNVGIWRGKTNWKVFSVPWQMTYSLLYVTRSVALWLDNPSRVRSQGHRLIEIVVCRLCAQNTADFCMCSLSLFYRHPLLIDMNLIEKYYLHTDWFFRL